MLNFCFCKNNKKIIIIEGIRMVVVVKDFYYNGTPKAPPTRKYGEVIRS